MRRRWREPAAIAAEIDRIHPFAAARCAAAAVAAGVRTRAPCRKDLLGRMMAARLQGELLAVLIATA
jgi:hypothetical protein